MYKPSLQAEVLKNSQEVEFINQDKAEPGRAQCKMRERIKHNIDIGINIEKKLGGRMYKPSLQAEVLQNAREV